MRRTRCFQTQRGESHMTRASPPRARHGDADRRLPVSADDSSPRRWWPDTLTRGADRPPFGVGVVVLIAIGFTWSTSARWPSGSAIGAQRGHTAAWSSGPDRDLTRRRARSAAHRRRLAPSPTRCWLRRAPPGPQHCPWYAWMPTHALGATPCTTRLGPGGVNIAADRSLGVRHVAAADRGRSPEAVCVGNAPSDQRSARPEVFRGPDRRRDTPAFATHRVLQRRVLEPELARGAPT
jgi:hypothetical protein